MKERGIAIKIEGNSAEVRLLMVEGCGHCASSGECSAGKRTVKAIIPDGVHVAAGDAVVMDIPDSVRTAGLFWLVVLPLALFVGGYLGAGRLFDGAEGPQVIGGLAGIAAGLGLAVLATRRGPLGRDPVITSVAAFDAGDEAARG